MKKIIFLLAAFLCCCSLAFAQTAEEYYAQYSTLYKAKQYEEAIIPLQKAVDMGLAVAQKSLGNRFLYGEGVLKDLTKAFYWYEKAEIGRAHV